MRLHEKDRVLWAGSDVLLVFDLSLALVIRATRRSDTNTHMKVPIAATVIVVIATDAACCTFERTHIASAVFIHSRLSGDRATHYFMISFSILPYYFFASSNLRGRRTL